MQPQKTHPIIVTLLLGTVALCGTAAHAQLTSFTSSGADTAAIQTTVDNFRDTLGVDNGIGGTFLTGRREINWDDVPNEFTDPNLLPGNFFNTNVPQGAVFTTPGSGFLVSDNAIGGNGQPIRFGFPNDFSTFSAQKLFTPLNANITDVRFFVPGTNTQATVSGFGTVFTDVEAENVTSVEYFAADNSLLGTLFSPTTGNQGLSFVGATSTTPIFRVRITTGNSALVGNGNAGSAQDVAVMDNFIYAEPSSLGANAPEPSSLALLGMMTGSLVIKLRRNKR